MSRWEKGKEFVETHVLPYTIIYLSTFVVTMGVSGSFFIQEYGLEAGLAAAYVFTKALTPVRMAFAMIGTYYYVQAFQ
tara:strand:+ start:1112 stop:1345 length:234 start_codon:yes stop_codon:yes gene_type:complete